MNYKVIARSRRNGRQYKKWVYTSKDKFDKYSPGIIKRYSEYEKSSWFRDAPFDIEVYHMVSDEWIRII